MEFLFIIIILIMSVVVHEVSHGYAALALGDKTAKYEGRLTLNPLAHLDPVGSIVVPLIGYFAGGFIVGWAKPVPFNPYNLKNQKWGEAIVAIAGPMSNLALATIFGLFVSFAPLYFSVSSAFLVLSIYVVKINVTLAIFNLMPIPPLDGSKILFSILPQKWHGFLESFENFGLIFLIFIIFFLWDFLTPVINVISKILINL